MPTLARDKILVVDDEPMICKNCKEILEGEGYSVDMASSGQEGVKKALEKLFDLVIVDMKMPDLSGMTLLKRLKGEKLQTPVVMITAYSTLETAIEAMKLGAADYIPKPFTPDELSGVVKMVISGESLADRRPAGQLIDKESVARVLEKEWPRAECMIDADIEKCIGCQMCMVDCAAHHADENSLPIAYPKAWDLLPESRLFVDLDGALPVPLLCKHCENAPCATVCPTGAIRIDEKHGFKVLDKEKCIGCRSCLLTCPFGLISMDNEGRAAQKCDMCLERFEEGIEPVCMQVCPRGVLTVKPVTGSMDGARKKTAEQCGGVPGGKKLKAVQTGGPSGGCVPEDLIDMPVDFDELTKAGSMMGSGGMIIMDENTCMVDVARYFLDFLKDESCGKCLPCREGIKRMLEILNRICAGKGEEGDIELLQEIARTVQDTSLCALGGSAPNPLLTTLKYFGQEYVAHVRDKKCPAGICKDLITYGIAEDRCNGCGLCAKACPNSAITGEKKKPHHIDVVLCTKCGICAELCRRQAIAAA